jgi:hypothetical protein
MGKQTRILPDFCTKQTSQCYIPNQNNNLHNQRLCSASVANKIQTWNRICQEPRNELHFFWLSDRYSVIWIDPSGPTIAESIGCCLLSGHGPACPQTHRSSQALHTKHELAALSAAAGRLKLKQDDACLSEELQSSVRSGPRMWACGRPPTEKKAVQLVWNWLRLRS